MVVIALLIGVMVGCQKEEDTYICNFENPYDYVGNYHNEGLLYVLDKLKADNSIRLKSSEIDIEQATCDLTREFCAQNPLKGAHFSNESLSASFQTVQNIRLKSTDSQHSDIRHIYHTKFEKILDNPDGCNSLFDVLNRIRIIEEEIFQSNMDVTDKEALLVTYAIGRNSLEFWLSLNKEACNVPRLKSGSEDSFLTWWTSNVMPAVRSVVTADFAGAAAGFLEGAITGATGGTVLMPGVGSVTGAIVGGVGVAAAGAIYGSVIGGALYYFQF